MQVHSQNSTPSPTTQPTASTTSTASKLSGGLSWCASTAWKGAAWAASKTAECTVVPLLQRAMAPVVSKACAKYETKCEDEKTLNRITGSSGLSELVKEVAAHFPGIILGSLPSYLQCLVPQAKEERAALESKLFIHILATFAKSRIEPELQEGEYCKEEELIVQFFTWISDCCDKAALRDPSSSKDLEELAKEILDQTLPELNSGLMFGFPQTFLSRILFDISQSKKAIDRSASELTPLLPFVRREMAEVKEGFYQKSKKEKMLSHIQAFLPACSEASLSTLATAFFEIIAPKDSIAADLPEGIRFRVPSSLPTIEKMIAKVLNSLLSTLCQGPVARAALQPFFENGIDSWSPYIQKLVVNYIKDEAAIPQFLKQSLIGYIEKNLETLLLGKYNALLQRAKYVIDNEYPLLVDNPLRGSEHEAEARAFAKSLATRILPNDLPMERLLPAFTEIVFQSLGRAYNQSSEKEFLPFLKDYQEQFLLKINAIYEQFSIKDKVEIKDVSELLYAISPSIALAYPKAVSLVYKTLSHMMALTRPLSQKEAKEMSERIMPDVKLAQDFRKSLSEVIDAAISKASEQSLFPPFSLPLGKTICPFLGGLKQGALRIFLQIASDPLPALAQKTVLEIESRMEQKKKGENVEKELLEKVKELLPTVPPKEAIWLFETLWPRSKKFAIPILQLRAKLDGKTPDSALLPHVEELARFLADKIKAPLIQPSTLLFLLEKAIFSAFLAQDPEGTLSADEAVEKLFGRLIVAANNVKEVDALPNLLQDLFPELQPFQPEIQKAITHFYADWSAILHLSDSINPAGELEKYSGKKGFQGLSEMISSLIEMASTFLPEKLLSSIGVGLGTLQKPFTEAVEKNGEGLKKSLTQFIKVIVESLLLNLIRRGESSAPDSDSMIGLLIAGIESLIKEISPLIPQMSDSEVERDRKIVAIINLVFGDLASRVPNSIKANLARMVNRLLSKLAF